MSKAKTETYASVWDALADTPEEATNLRARRVDAAEAAKRCGVTQPRINDLPRQRVSSATSR